MNQKEFKLNTIKMTEEQKLKVAELLYPVGTRFYPAYLDCFKKEDYCTITEDSHFEVHRGTVYSYIGDTNFLENEGNVRIIYDANLKEWAKLWEDPNAEADEFLKAKGIFNYNFYSKDGDIKLADLLTEFKNK